MGTGTVFICHHIDTEGPLWENINELFSRLKLIFGLDLPATYENLQKLQTGEIRVADDLEPQLLKTIDPHTVNFKKNWEQIEVMLDRIMSEEYRNVMLDSFGGGWVYNWHIMDHVGFGHVNPRHRDTGYHNILDFYTYQIEKTQSKQDSIHWHFHPIPFYGQCHVPATSYENSMSALHQIISRRLIERDRFITVNRAGFHTERVDANFFIEQWMPFDPSNQSVSEMAQPFGQQDLVNGRYGDWRGAPDDWSLYHPDLYDWRKKGNAKHWKARILNLKSRHRSITEQEIEKAFCKAVAGENVYLGITDHDWREMSVEIDEFRQMLGNVARKYPNVRFKFSDTIEAFRKVIGYSEEECNKEKLAFDLSLRDNLLVVDVTNGTLFGPQPYLALQTMEGAVFHDNFDCGKSDTQFVYTFDEYTVPIRYLKKIAVASNDKYGNCCIRSLSL